MLMTDEAYQTKGWRAATYLITNEIKAFKFRDGAPLPREWGKGRLVSYKLFNDFSTRLSDSFLGLSKRPAHLQDIFTYLAEKLHEDKAVIMTYIFRESYGWAQLRCGISIKFDLDHLSPDLNIIFRNKHRRYEQPRVILQYEAWEDERGKIKSLATRVTLVALDEAGKGPFDPNNGLGPIWDWFEH